MRIGQEKLPLVMSELGGHISGIDSVHEAHRRIGMPRLVWGTVANFLERFERWLPVGVILRPGIIPWTCRNGFPALAAIRRSPFGALKYEAMVAVAPVFLHHLKGLHGPPVQVNKSGEMCLSMLLGLIAGAHAPHERRAICNVDVLPPERDRLLRPHAGKELPVKIGPHTLVEVIAYCPFIRPRFMGRLAV